jgi:hypothetical protein
MLITTVFVSGLILFRELFRLLMCFHVFINLLFPDDVDIAFRLFATE